MENFEAIGRYVAAKEQAEKFHRDRDSALSRVQGICESAISNRQTASDYFDAKDFAFQEAEHRLKEAAEAHQNMVTAIEEANRQAEICGRPKLNFR